MKWVVALLARDWQIGAHITCHHDMFQTGCGQCHQAMVAVEREGPAPGAKRLYFDVRCSVLQAGGLPAGGGWLAKRHHRMKRRTKPVNPHPAESAKAEEMRKWGGGSPNVE